MPIIKLDPTSMFILTAIQKEKTIREMAEVIQLSLAAIHERIDGLINSGLAIKQGYGRYQTRSLTAQGKHAINLKEKGDINARDDIRGN